MGCELDSLASWGAQTLDCGVEFKRSADHTETGDSSIEDGGEVEDDTPVSEIRIRVIIFDQHLSDV